MRKFLLFILLMLPLSQLCADGLDEARRALQSGDNAQARLVLQKAILDLPAGSARHAEALAELIPLEPQGAEKKYLLERFLRDYPGHAYFGAFSWDLYYIYLGEDRYADALRVILPLQDRAPLREQALAALAALSLEAGKEGECAGYLAAFFREFPASPFMPRMLLCRAQTHRMKNDEASAQKDYTEILTKYGEDSHAAAAYLALAELAGNAGDRRLARSYADKLIAAFPQSFEASLARRMRLAMAAEGVQVLREVRVWEVQLAAFFVRAQAEHFLSDLSKKGYASFIQEDTENGRTQYSVRMGYFRTRNDAEIVLKELQTKGHEGFIRTRTVMVSEDELE